VNVARPWLSERRLVTPTRHFTERNRAAIVLPDGYRPVPAAPPAGAQIAHHVAQSSGVTTDFHDRLEQRDWRHRFLKAIEPPP
jgi:hypothetical protein